MKFTIQKSAFIVYLTLEGRVTIGTSTGVSTANVVKDELLEDIEGSLQIEVHLVSKYRNSVRFMTVQQLRDYTIGA
jgi:hypothetical protein